MGLFTQKVPETNKQLFKKSVVKRGRKGIDSRNRPKVFIGGGSENSFIWQNRMGGEVEKQSTHMLKAAVTSM